MTENADLIDRLLIAGELSPLAKEAAAALEAAGVELAERATADEYEEIAAHAGNLERERDAALTAIREALAVLHSSSIPLGANALWQQQQVMQEARNVLSAAVSQGAAEASGYARFADTASVFPTAVATEIGLWMRSAGYNTSMPGEYERWVKDYNLPHEFRPVAGHPDDDECTDRRDGTDATYCGLPRRLHEYPHNAEQEAGQ